MSIALGGQNPVQETAYEIWVVNLDRRSDRLTTFQSHLEEVAGRAFASRCRRFEGVDGISHELTEEQRKLFDGNHFGNRRGVIGCALSHLNLWKVISLGTASAAVIFEDDVRVLPNFVNDVDVIYESIESTTPDWDIVYLDYSFWPGMDDTLGRRSPGIRTMRWERYLGGCYCYLISRSGATKLVDIAHRRGIRNPIDAFVQDNAKDVRAFESMTKVASSSYAHLGNAVDTDIQRDFTPVAENFLEHPSLSSLFTALSVFELDPNLSEDPLEIHPSIHLTDDGFTVNFRRTDRATECRSIRFNFWMNVVSSMDVPVGDSVTASSTDSGESWPGGHLGFDENRSGAHRFVMRNGRNEIVMASSWFRFLEDSPSKCGGYVLGNGCMIILLVPECPGFRLAVVKIEEVLSKLKMSQ